MNSSAMNRRKMLGLVAGAAPLLAAAPSLLGAEAPRKRLGVCTYSYNLHWKAAREGPVPKTRLRQYFCRKSVRILFWMAGSLVMSAVPIKAGPFALPIQIRTGLPRLMRFAFQVSFPV